MKLFFRLILLMCFSLSGAQEAHNYTKIDENISLKMPGEVTMLDSVNGNMKMRQYFSNLDNATFAIQRYEIGKNTYKSSLTLYKGIIDGYVKGMANQGYEFVKSVKKDIGAHAAYRVLLNKDGKPSLEVQFLIFEDYIYTIQYLNFIDFDEDTKEAYLSSIVINASKPGK